MSSRSVQQAKTKPYTRLMANLLFRYSSFLDCPKNTINKARAYLHSIHPEVTPYNPSQVHRTEVLLDFSTKTALMTVKLAYSPINLLFWKIYLNHEVPQDISGINPNNIINIDEMGFKIENLNCLFGKNNSLEEM